MLFRSLASRARVVGNVFYKLIEMTMGAEVNGNLVHSAENNRENDQPKLLSGSSQAINKPKSVDNSG